jgi:hypothetical protein
MFVFERMFEFDMFMLEVFVWTVGMGVGIGVGVAIVVFRFRLLLLAVLFDVASPHAIAAAPVANTAISAIFFIIFRDLLSSSKLI